MHDSGALFNGSVTGKISHMDISMIWKDPAIRSALPTSALTVVAQHIVSVMGSDAAASQVLMWP